jgi:hypothetical protein
MIITSRFLENLVWIRLIDLNRKSINSNIIFPINEISSSIINCNWSYFLTKLFNHFELNDGKYLQLSGIEVFEWVVVPSMLNVSFQYMPWARLSFLKGLNEDVYNNNASKLELKALMWKIYMYLHLQ